jgi:hypothetical protein
MTKGEVEIEPIPGQRSFNRKPGLAHWEFINALEHIGVRTSRSICAYPFLLRLCQISNI